MQFLFLLSFNCSFVSLLPSSSAYINSLCSLFTVDRAKHGCKCNNNVCVRNECSVSSTRALTLRMARHGKNLKKHTHVGQHNDINTCDLSPPRSRSQTLSPVRNYNTLTTGKESKFVQIKQQQQQQQQQQMKPYKVSAKLFLSIIIIN
jgi:hypothetical protein